VDWFETARTGGVIAVLLSVFWLVITGKLRLEREIRAAEKRAEEAEKRTEKSEESGAEWKRLALRGTNPEEQATGGVQQLTEAIRELKR